MENEQAMGCDYCAKPMPDDVGDWVVVPVRTPAGGIYPATLCPEHADKGPEVLVVTREQAEELAETGMNPALMIEVAATEALADEAGARLDAASDKLAELTAKAKADGTEESRLAVLAATAELAGLFKAYIEASAAEASAFASATFHPEVRALTTSRVAALDQLLTALSAFEGFSAEGEK